MTQFPFQMDHPGMTGLDMLGSPHSSNGGSNGDVVGPPMTPLPPGMSDHIAAAAAQVSKAVSLNSVAFYACLDSSRESSSGRVAAFL